MAIQKKTIFIISGVVLALVAAVLIIRKINSTPSAPAKKTTNTADEDAAQKIVLSGSIPSSAKPVVKTTTTVKAPITTQVAATVNPASYDDGDIVYARGPQELINVTNGVTTYTHFDSDERIGIFKGITSGTTLAWINGDDGRKYTTYLKNIYN